MPQNGEGNLSFSDKERVACARCLGVDPARILEITGSPDGNGGTRYTLRISLDVHGNPEYFVGLWGPREHE